MTNTPGIMSTITSGLRPTPENSAGHRRWALAAVLIACAATGCGRKIQVADETESKSQEALRAVAAAYNAALAKRGKPPAGPDDIVPFLPKGVSPEDALRSPQDDQPFVIIWGADPRKGMDVNPLVIGYEAQGKNGRRMVFTAMGVFTMTDARFKEARFPEGHTP